MNYIDRLKQIYQQDKIFIDEPMKNHTSFKIGGPCDVLVFPKSIDQLKMTLETARIYNKKIFCIGNGSNLLISDDGLRGIVIKTSDLDEIFIDGNIINAGAGALLSKVSKIAMEHSLTGLEFASGIPGSIGGAAFMNAGAYGGQMSDVVISVTYLDFDGNIHEKICDDNTFSYRSSIFQDKDLIILDLKVKLKKGIKENIQSKMFELNSKRREKQPLTMPNAGSIFKRPEGCFAGKLIEDCNFRGYRVGDAMVSDKHCGFIVNCGDATAKDVLKLIEIINNKVKEEFDVILEIEVKYLG